MEKIVVGVDGSAGSRAALRWAWDEAKAHGAALEIVVAWQFPITTSLPAFGSMPTPDDLERGAVRLRLVPRPPQRRSRPR